MAITHAKVSTRPPSSNAELVDSDDWNAAHVGEAEGPLTSVVVNLDSADIATLNSVPVEVVTAQGAGKVIVPVAASFQFVAGATAFDASGVLALRLATNAVLEGADPVFDFSDDNFASFATADAAAMTLADVVNEPLTLTCDVEPDGAGDGTARLQVLYFVMDLA